MAPTPALPELPITAVLPALTEAMATRPQVILQAPPGAGKTTLVPLWLMDQPWLRGQKIIVLEPRRVAARNCAQQMAKLLGEPVGQRLGYRIRQEVRVSAATQIEVITGGVFTRMLQDDPSLEGIGLVIFDEFHERHLDSDLGLALSLQAQQLFRDDPSAPLRLLVMSATLDTAGLQQLLPAAPLITSEGRMFPVSLHHGKTPPLRESPLPALTQTVLQAINQHPGNMLVFLPGQREIQQLQQALSGALPTNCQILPLYSGLSLSDQQKAISPLADANTRKVVLATNIAETSLTIEGVTLVVDSGLCREPSFDPNTGLTRLHTQRISRASATQRAGRAGRLAPGQCFRLWSAEQVLNEQSTPEILQADLAPLALQLISWGIHDPAELAWLNPPPKASYRQGLDLLLGLGAIREPAPHQLVLTPAGRQMLSFPAHPRLAHMLLQSRAHGCGPQACWLAALLSETSRGPNQTDLALLVEWLERNSADLRPFTGWREAISLQAKHFRQMLDAQPAATQLSRVAPPDAVGFLLACAYPDRVAKRREAAKRSDPSISYQLANRRAASMPSSLGLANSEWLVVATTGGQAGRSEDQIYAAAALNPNLFNGPLANMPVPYTQLEWDKKLGRFVGLEQTLVGALVLSEKRLASIPPEAKRQALLNLLRAEGLQLLPWCEPSQQLQARVELLRQHYPSLDWPDFSSTGLLARLETWLGPHLDAINKLEDFAKLALPQLLQQQLPWPLAQQLEQLAPGHWTVPTGSQIAIDYTSQPPTLAVKLQEMFGASTSPAVAQGRVQLCLHLLSPARRPLQITQDLAGFWQSSYHDVKKDMKGRYPKHPWPDDPINAIPQRGVKKRPD